MSKRISFLATFVFLAVFWTLPALAQFGAFEGDVRGADGKGLVGAQIVLDRTDMKGHWETKTDKKGHYYYGGLPLGTFKIVLKVDGKDVDFVNNIRLRLGDPVKQDFAMKQVEVRQQAAAAGIQIAPPAQGGEAPKLSKEQIAKIQEENSKREAQ